MTFTTRKWDCGVIHGHDAGHLTIYENNGRFWMVYELVWHPVRGGPVFLGEYSDLKTAKAAGEREFERRAALVASGGR